MLTLSADKGGLGAYALPGQMRDPSEGQRPAFRRTGGLAVYAPLCRGLRDVPGRGLSADKGKTSDV